MNSDTTDRIREDLEAPSWPGAQRLDLVGVGHCATILEVQAGEAEIDQLKAMGVCSGRRIMVVQAGDPMILKVLGSRIGLSARLAKRVYVDACLGDMFGSLSKD